MQPKEVLILGAGHLAYKTQLLLKGKGCIVKHVPDITSDQSFGGGTTISAAAKVLEQLDMATYSMSYILFDKDEDNLEVVIAMMALHPNIPIATALFNENIRPHLLKANPNLIIHNPARIAAPVFVQALDNSASNKRHVFSSRKIMPKKKNKLSTLVLLVSIFSVIVFSAISYFHFAENLSWLDAIYFVIVTIATVGYGDINLLHAQPISKIIGILLIMCSTVFIWLIFSLLIDRIIKRRAQLSLGRKKYNYKNHIVLCGLGRLGYFIAKELHKKGERFVIVESDISSPNVAHYRNLDIDVYIGNARLPHVLEDVGVANCRAVISVVDDDYANLEIGLNARSFQEDVMIVLRIFDESMAAAIKDKFDMHLTESMSYIAAVKFASMVKTETE